MITEEVGKRIRYLRLQKGLSQEELAFKAKIDRTYLSGIESAKRNATLVSMDKVLKALEVSWADFFSFNLPVDYK